MNSLSVSYADVCHFSRLYEARLYLAKSTHGLPGFQHWRVLFGSVRINPEVDLAVAKMRLELALAIHRFERKQAMA